MAPSPPAMLQARPPGTGEIEKVYQGRVTEASGLSKNPRTWPQSGGLLTLSVLYRTKMAVLFRR
jgi:hypothetical protein